MSSFAKLYASMENEEELVEAVPEVTTDDVIEAQEVTEEVAEAEAEVEEVQEAIEEGVQDAETLETVADTLEETVEDGGADPATAQMAEVAVESIYRRLGIQAKAMPALEAFNDKEQRIAATKLAIEGIKETAQKVWEAIVNFFKNLWQAFGRLWEKVKNLFRNNTKVLTSLLNEIKGMEVAEAELKGGAVNRLLADFFGVKDSTVSDTISRITPLADKFSKLEQVSESVVKSVDAIYDEIVKKFDGKEEITSKEALDFCFDFIQEPAKAYLGLGTADGGSDLEKMMDPGIFGNVKIVKESVLGNRGIVVYSGVKRTGASIVNDNSAKKDKSVKVSKDEMIKLLDFTLGFIKKTEGLKFNKVFTDLDGAIKKNKAKFDGMKGSEIRAKIILAAIRGSVTKVSKDLANTNMSILKSQALLGNYVIGTAKQFKSAATGGAKEEAKAE